MWIQTGFACFFLVTFMSFCDLRLHVSAQLNSVERMDELKRAFLSRSKEVKIFSGDDKEKIPAEPRQEFNLEDLSHLFDNSSNRHHDYVSGLPSLLNIIPAGSSSSSEKAGSSSALHRLKNKGKKIVSMRVLTSMHAQNTNLASYDLTIST